MIWWHSFRFWKEQGWVPPSCLPLCSARVISLMPNSVWPPVLILRAALYKTCAGYHNGMLSDLFPGDTNTKPCHCMYLLYYGSVMGLYIVSGRQCTHRTHYKRTRFTLPVKTFLRKRQEWRKGWSTKTGVVTSWPCKHESQSMTMEWFASMRGASTQCKLQAVCCVKSPGE